MIDGRVTELCEAIVTLDVKGSNGQSERFDVIVDTGYNGSLTLPQNAIDGLALPYVDTEELTLADESVVAVALHEGVLNWDGDDKAIEIHCAEGPPLLGMSLLFGHRMLMDIVEDGPVNISPLKNYGPKT